MKKILFASLISIASACAQTYAPHDPEKIQITPAEPANIIRGQLLLQFSGNVSVLAARNRASQCGSIIRVVIVNPALILVQRPVSKGGKSDIQTCLKLPGLDRAEWNQKRHLR